MGAVVRPRSSWDRAFAVERPLPQDRGRGWGCCSNGVRPAWHPVPAGCDHARPGCPLPTPETTILPGHHRRNKDSDCCRLHPCPTYILDCRLFRTDHDLASRRSLAGLSETTTARQTEQGRSASFCCEIAQKPDWAVVLRRGAQRPCDSIKTERPNVGACLQAMHAVSAGFAACGQASAWEWVSRGSNPPGNPRSSGSPRLPSGVAR